MAEHLDAARELGSALADLIDYPEEYVAALRVGLTGLADESIPPSRSASHPAQAPSSVFARRCSTRPCARSGRRCAKARRPRHCGLPTDWQLEKEREFVFFCHQALERSLAADPERSWQLMRQVARHATDWIRVDSLAGVWARGILLESLALERAGAARLLGRPVGAPAGRLDHRRAAVRAAPRTATFAGRRPGVGADSLADWRCGAGGAESALVGAAFVARGRSCGVSALLRSEAADRACH